MTKIYQVVDGKLVAKPGNQRAPGRRYAAVVAAGESYLREFTEEEEAARDAEEAKWEAQRPLREAAERDRQRRWEEYCASLKYETRLCAFLDVLGWRDAIFRSETDPELVKRLGVSLHGLVAFSSQVVWQQEHDFPGAPRVTQFSDCIFLSASPDHAGKSFLTSAFWFLYSTFIAKGFCLRGGVTLGQLYHDGQSVFGPALVRAYDIERSALFPRVVLDEDLVEHWWPGDSIQDQSGSRLGHFKTWRKCWTDGKVFFDYLQPIGATTHLSPTKEHVEVWVQPARNLAIAQLGQEDLKEKDRKKYVWLAEYCNDVCREYGLAEPIAIGS